MNPFLERLKNRKVVQWLLAYLGGAWALLEVSDILGGQFGWPLVAQRAFTVALGVGAVVTVVLAWYHGEKGRQRVSGFELLILAGVLGLGGGAMALAAGGDRTLGLESELDVDLASSLAVLPFENRSADEADIYFTDGIHDEILTRFSSLSALRVISRTSAMSYRGTDKTVPQIAQELGVRYVVEGAVQRAGGRVRITAQLLDGERDEHLWAETFDREATAENLFAVQTEIATVIARALGAELTPEEREVIDSRPTENLQAYDRYLQARALPTDVSLEAALEAEALYEESVGLDPNFYEAWVSLARLRSWLTWGFGGALYNQKAGPALAALEQVESMRPEADQAHVVRGVYTFYTDPEGTWEEALSHFEAADQITDERELQIYAGLLRRVGRWDDSVQLLRGMVEASPRSRGALGNLGGTLVRMRQFEEGILYLDRALDLVEAASTKRIRAVGVLGLHGDTTELQSLVDDSDDPSIRAWAAYLRRDFGSALAESAPQGVYWAVWAPDAALRRMPGLWEQASVRQVVYGDSLRSLAAMDMQVPWAGMQARAHASLSMAAALDGDRETALSRGERALETFPISAGAITGVRIQHVVSISYMLVGETERAIDLLEELVSVPSDVHPVWLRYDPFYDQLREHPRFQRLLAVHD